MTMPETVNSPVENNGLSVYNGAQLKKQLEDIIARNMLIDYYFDEDSPDYELRKDMEEDLFF